MFNLSLLLAIISSVNHCKAARNIKEKKGIKKTDFATFFYLPG